MSTARALCPDDVNPPVSDRPVRTCANLEDSAPPDWRRRMNHRFGSIALLGMLSLLAGCSTQKLPSGTTLGGSGITQDQARRAPQDATSKAQGNVLIADQFNNRVIETDPEGHIVWSFGLGPNDFSPRSV